MKLDKSQQIITTICAIFFGFAIICFVFAYYFYIPTQAVDTTGTFISMSEHDNDGERVCDSKISYTIDGESFVSSLNECLDKYQSGDEIKIYYLKDRPDTIGTRSKDIITTIFGTFALGVFEIMFVHAAKSSNYKTSLKRWQSKGAISVNANFDHVERRAPTKKQWIVVCKWKSPKNGETYEFGSHRLSEDPTEFIKLHNITTFRVYLDDEGDPNNHFIDLSPLEQASGTAKPLS